MHEPREWRWLRPIGLFALAVGLAVGQPLVVVGVTFSLLTLVVPDRRWFAVLVAAIAIAVVFAAAPAGGLWYVERGWALLVGGAFAAYTMAWPNRPFLPRALWSLAAGTAVGAAILLASDGWDSVELLMVNRIEASVSETLALVAPLNDGSVQPQLEETVARTAELQGILFPSLVALSTLASMGVGWWLHFRLTTRSDQGLRPFREFRFPDPLIWVFIAGVVLVLTTGWTAGWGRAGTNLVAFMGALYILRGLGVVVFFLGGLSLMGGILLGLALLLAAPLLLGGALLIGMGDSWLDLRSRLPSTGSGGPR